MHILWRKLQETGWPCKQFCPCNYQNVLQTSPPVSPSCEALSILQIGIHHKNASQIALCPSYQLLSSGEWNTGTQQIARGAQYFKGCYARLLALEEWQWLRWQQAYINAKDSATSTAVGADPGLENSREIPIADVKMKLPQALNKTNKSPAKIWSRFPFHCLSQAKLFFWTSP